MIKKVVSEEVTKVTSIKGAICANVEFIKHISGRGKRNHVMVDDTPLMEGADIHFPYHGQLHSAIRIKPYGNRVKITYEQHK